jgi:hypothetical protein
LIDHPPKPRLALTVGVTGHRLHRAPPPGGGEAPAFDVAAVETALLRFFRAVAAGLASIDGEARRCYEPGPPALTLISSLAEGADRLAAKAALAAGFALDVLLPCPPAIYGETFADDASRQEFAALLASARSRLVLPLAGGADQTQAERLPRSFEAAGLVMLAQSDILVAVWDGLPARGRGGAGEIVDEAARRGAPIVVVDPANGATRALVCDDLFDETAPRRAVDVAPRAVEACLPAIVARLTSPPDSPRERAGLAHFLSCRVGRRAAVRASAVFDGGDVPGAVVAWPRVSAAIAASPGNRGAVNRYSEALRAAEQVAGRGARGYRRLFTLSFAATAVASFLVAGSARFRELHAAATVFELGAVALVAGLVVLATRRRWRERWFEAREVVERLRIVATPWLLGAWPASLKPGQTAWPGWYARAVARAQPLFSGDLGELIGEARAILGALIDEQSSYHRRNAERLQRRDRFIEGLGMALLVATLADNALYLALRFVFKAPLATIEPWVLAASIFLPAAATAAYGVRLFGDFEDLARRSRRAAEQLEALKARMSDASDLSALRALADHAARAMLADLEAWRVAVESRRLSAG